MSTDQRAIAALLSLIDEAMESNTLHDALGTWRALAEIKVIAEALSVRVVGQATLDEITHGSDL